MVEHGRDALVEHGRDALVEHGRVAMVERHRPDVIVIGGGLAGIAACLRLADSGCSVRLLEVRGRLGGAAFSFRRGGLTVDNGQHVFLRCCTEYRALLERLGAVALTSLQPRLCVPVLAGDGPAAHLARTPGLPAPAHLLASLARYRPLSVADRARAGLALRGLQRLDLDDPALDGSSFGSFLRAHGQSTAAINRLWSIIGTATLNAEPDAASLALAAKVFGTGLLDRADAADIGYAQVPLGRIHDTAAREALTAAGVQVLLKHRARRVDPGRVEVSGPAGDQVLTAEEIVLAVPPPALSIVAALHGGLEAAWSRLGSSPIVNVHLVYDRKVTDMPFAAAVDSPVHWIFDRTAAARADGGQYLAVTVSAADRLIDRPAREIIGTYSAEMQRLCPRARRARLLDAFVTRERRATFRQSPGTAALRPGADPGVDGLTLAGAWTATGWPDTMESAVRSGNAAAERVLSGTASSRPAVLR